MAINFLISGMFRSGTTMVARMLHANQNIICASDPFAPVFKSYRNESAKQLGIEIDPDSPISDYYFNKRQIHLFEYMQVNDFSLKFDMLKTEQLQVTVKKHCEPYSPMLNKYLHCLCGETYEEVFLNGIDIIHQSYNKKGASAIGFKDVWVDEFAPHFLNLGPNTRVIHLVRDPRSVVASNVASGSTYPLIFLARQWRKLASLAWLNASRYEQVKLIKFEDLLSSPKDVAIDVCDFLEVEYDESMSDPKSYKDGSGKPWHQNTSHISKDSDKTQQSFNMAAIDKWKKVLSPEVLELIDRLCYFEMKLLGYESMIDAANVCDIYSNMDFEDEVSTLAKWIKPYADYNNFVELAAESFRHGVITSGQKLSEISQRLLALDPTIYNAL